MQRLYALAVIMDSEHGRGLQHILTELSNWCDARPVRLCVCFGSQATGRARAASDVDVAIWPRGDVSLRDGLRWIAELEERLATPVSLVIVTPNLNPVLGFEIVRDGRPAYEESPGLWQHRRAQLWHAYNDSLPFRRAAREMLRAFARESAQETRHGA